MVILSFGVINLNEMHSVNVSLLTAVLPSVSTWIWVMQCTQLHMHVYT